MRLLALITTLCLTFRTTLAGRRPDITPQAWSNTQRNQSALWGYQLVGAQFADPKAVCGNIWTLSHGIWEFVDVGQVQRAFCDQVGWNDTDNKIDEMVTFFNTGMLLSQLMSAFDTEPYSNKTNTTLPNPYTHLCQTLSPTALQRYNLNPTTLLTTLCAAANPPLPPPADTNASLPTPTIPSWASPTDPIPPSHRDTLSILMGFMLVGSSTNSSDADALCFRVRDSIPGFWNMGFDGHQVWEIACGVNGRRWGEKEMGRVLRAWQGRVFAGVMKAVGRESAGGGEGEGEGDGDVDVGQWEWESWLCDHLSEGRLNVTGLMGKEVKRGVCGEAYYFYGDYGLEGCEYR